MKVNAIQKIVISLIALSVYSLASTQDCLSNIDREELKEELYTNGTFFTKKCAYTYPYLFITITNLDDPENIISITHAPKESDGYPLKTITEHAQRESDVTGKETILAINGFIEKDSLSDHNFVRCVRGSHTDLDIELNID